MSDKIHKRLLEDQKQFEDAIGGGDWDIDHTIKEYFKILDNLVDSDLKYYKRET